jgi:hypothetical protein
MSALTEVFDTFLRALGERDIGWSFPAFKRAWQEANLIYVCHLRNDDQPADIFMMDSYACLMGTFPLDLSTRRHVFPTRRHVAVSVNATCDHHLTIRRDAAH